MDKLYYDIIIIGGGAAGLRSAIEVSKGKNISCAVISKIHPLRSQTCMAQGGINAVLNDNSIEEHFIDTIKCADFLADQDAVEIFCEEAPDCLIEIEHMGMVFDRMENGSIAQRYFAGASSPRACYYKDFTGRVLLNTLFGEILKQKVPIYNEFFLHDLIIKNESICGVIVSNIKTGEIIKINSKAVILATGGAGNIYQNTVNAETTTGDGISIAFKAGAALKDIEFIQFHPTSLANKGILITEGSRAEGGYLINNRGERFMSKYDPKRMELAPRDVVARAIQQEINEGRDINGAVLLDLTHLGEQKIKSKLPQIYKITKDFTGIDCIKSPIPVKPSAHYFMGGIDVNINCETNIKGLFAAGECACVSIHGANRAGGNSLMETIVFGKRAGKTAVKFVQNTNQKNSKNIDSDLTKQISEKIRKISNRTKGIPYFKIKNSMQKTMEEYVGIFRTQKSLITAKQKLEELIDDYENVLIGTNEKSYNYALLEALDLENLLTVSYAVINCAEKRKESRGAHNRKDFPLRDDENFLKHSIAYYKNKKNIKIDYKKVSITSYKVI
jgi:succinate dehydrogenase/fumarate reductase flavoprotein subunit